MSPAARLAEGLPTPADCATGAQRAAYLRRRWLASTERDELLKQVARLRRTDIREAAGLGRLLVLAESGRGDPLRSARALRSLAQTCILQGRFPRALRLLSQACALGGAPYEVATASERATCLAELSRETEARELIRVARESLAGRSQAPRRALLDNAEGMLLQRMDRHAEALTCLDRARRTLARKGVSAALSAIDGNRANVLTLLGRYEHAARLYAKVTRYYTDQGMFAAANQAEYNHAYLDFLRGHFLDALLRLNGLRVRFEEVGDQRHVGLCDLDMAEIMIRLGRHEQVLEMAGRAQPVLRGQALAAEVARAQLFEAIALVRLGSLDKAAPRLDAAERDLEALGSSGWAAVCRQARAELFAASGASARARQEAARATEALDLLGQRVRAAEASTVQARIEVSAGLIDDARKRLEALGTDARESVEPWLRCEVEFQRSRALAALGELRPAAACALRAVRLLESNQQRVPRDPCWQAFIESKLPLYDHAIRMLLAKGGRDDRAHAFLLAERAASARTWDANELLVPDSAYETTDWSY